MQLLPMKKRRYRCDDCGNEIEAETNHRGAIYPICNGRCRLILNEHTENEIVLRKQTQHSYVKSSQAKEDGENG